MLIDLKFWSVRLLLSYENKAMIFFWVKHMLFEVFVLVNLLVSLENSIVVVVFMWSL